MNPKLLATNTQSLSLSGASSAKNSQSPGHARNELPAPLELLLADDTAAIMIGHGRHAQHLYLVISRHAPKLLTILYPPFHCTI